MFDEKTFMLIRAVLRDIWGLTLQRFAGFDDNIIQFDLGIRTHLKQGAAMYEKLREVVSGLRFGEIVMVQDALRMNTILFRISPDSPEYYAIGPFFSFPIEDSALNELGSENHLTLTQMRCVGALFRQAPDNLPYSVPLSVANNILHFGCGLENVSVVHLDFSKERIDLTIPAEDINERARKVENVYAHEAALLDAIGAGDDKRALAEGRYFMSTGIDRRLQDRLLSHRSLVYSANTLFCRVALSRGVHPMFCNEISEQFAKKLELCSSIGQIDQIYGEMCRDYSRLCREHNKKNCSPNIQKVLQYIQFNLSQELSLNAVAKGIGFSSGYISRRFKEEVGVSLNSYVKARRVDAACRLLERSDLSVREIASYIGIPDWNYFTKVFRREMGYTPSEYRKKNGMGYERDFEHPAEGTGGQHPG